MTDRLLAALEGFSGTLLLPGDPGYEHTRGVFNALIDKRPALIAQCRGVADIVAAVGFAREHGLEVSVRGGGHNVAGTAVTEGGVMVDLSRMRGIRVDSEAQTARVQGGVIWRDLNRETQLHGLAVPGGIVSSTGVAGLTLGGGLGWITGKYGLTVDNLLSAEVVTADGRVLTASGEEHEDLFWALRGGGGNFGVVSSFEYRLHPVGPVVTGGLVLHSYPKARELLSFCRDFMADAPRELAVDAALHFSPDGSARKLAGLAVCHVGPREQAEEDLRPLLAFGSPVEVQVGAMPYTAVNSMLDGAYPPGLLNYWKSSFLAELSDEAIDTMVEEFEGCPSPRSALVLRHFRGAVADVPV
ncbi:MAG: FAD-binding oxidoreductase, partial [Gaiellaceae bacterium]